MMTGLYSHIRFGVSTEKLSDDEIRSLLIGEILWNISQIETGMSLVIGRALGMNEVDALHSIRDLNLDSKIRILKSHASRISIKFKTDTDKKKFFKDIEKLKDFRNALAHGVIFSDEGGLYLNIPTRASIDRNSSSVSLKISDLQQTFLTTTFVASGFLVGGRGTIMVGSE